MGITVGEITAVLTARDEMSETVKNAQKSIEDFKGSATDSSQQVAKGLDDLATHATSAAADTVSATKQMGTGFGGARIALNEMATGAGITVAELGALTAAGLVVGTAIGAWKITRSAAEFFDLDTAIGNATAKLLGWGDAAAEAAGNKADMLARASAKIGYEVRDVSTAMQINAMVIGYWGSGSELAAAALGKVQAKLEEVRSRGDIPALTADIQSHNYSLKDLAAYYNTTVEALQLLMRETKAADDAEKAANDEIQRRNRFKLEALREEMAEKARLRKQDETAIFQLTELEAKADEAATSRSRDRLKLDETAAQQRMAMELALDQQRVTNGTMTEKQFLAEKSFLERQAFDRHLELLKAEAEADITANGQKLNAELARIDERYAKGLLTKEQYEAQYAAVESRYATMRAGLQDAYAAHVAAAQQKVALSAEQAQAAMVAAFDKTNQSVMGITSSFYGWNESIMKVETSLKKLAAAKEMLDRGNTLDLPTAAQDPEINGYLKQGYSLKNAEALKLARQYGFAPQLFDEHGNPETSPSKGEGVPGYAPAVPVAAPPQPGTNIISVGAIGGGANGGITANVVGGGQDQGGIGNLPRLGYGGVTLTVNVQGNVMTMDPAGKTAFGQLIIDAVSPMLRQGRLLPSV